MAKIELHPDFKDFLRLLTSYNVRYLLVGGYAVGYHGWLDFSLGLCAITYSSTKTQLNNGKCCVPG